jgi:hypothetical protein
MRTLPSSCPIPGVPLHDVLRIGILRIEAHRRREISPTTAGNYSAWPAPVRDCNGRRNNQAVNGARSAGRLLPHQGDPRQDSLPRALFAVASSGRMLNASAYCFSAPGKAPIAVRQNLQPEMGHFVAGAIAAYNKFWRNIGIANIFAELL